MKLGSKIGIGIMTVTLMIPIIWVCSMVYFLSSDYEEDKLRFDREMWVIDQDCRHFMVTDLIENHLIIGMDSAAVKEILGEPERNFGFSYNMGLYRSGFDPTFLILEFDEIGKLKRINIETI